MQQEPEVELGSLVPLHNALRNPSILPVLLQSEKISTILSDRPIPIIRIRHHTSNRNPRPIYFVRDCHHASVASLHYRIINNMSWVLNPDEYKFEDMTFSDMWTANPPVGWVTPFNPITHVRKIDFFGYKQQAMKYHNENPGGDISDFIARSFPDYAELREVLTMKDLYLKYKEVMNAERNTVGINPY